MRARGITYDRSDYAFPRVHVDCDFMLAMAHDDLIEIEVCLTRLGRSSARFEFRTFKGDDLAAKGTVVIACMDRRTQRAIPIPDDLRAKLVSAADAYPNAAEIGG